MTKIHYNAMRLITAVTCTMYAGDTGDDEDDREDWDDMDDEDKRGR